MRNLTTDELDFVTKCPIILNEYIERPNSKRVPSKNERISYAFADVSNELTSYRVSSDEKLRNIHKIVNSFKGEDPEYIKSVVKSYYPRMSKKDISLLVDNALSV